MTHAGHAQKAISPTKIHSSFVWMETAALELFARVAQTGSFSQTARELGLTQPTVSRTISALEREVGAALLVRTTRAVALTEAGVGYLSRIEPILAALAEANQAVSGASKVRGRLRVAMPLSVGLREVIPRLPAFTAKHPELHFDLVMEDLRQNLIRDGIDVAIRIGRLVDTAVARKLGTNCRLLVAAPDYLGRAGTPKFPRDLVRHLILRGPAGLPSGGIEFNRRGRKVRIRLHPRVTFNNNEGGTAAAIAGLGIMVTGELGARAELASGALVRVLPDWDLGCADIHAVFAAGRAATPAARAFVDYLAGEFVGSRAVGRALLD